jgi:hypothetical protein
MPRVWDDRPVPSLPCKIISIASLEYCAALHDLLSGGLCIFVTTNHTAEPDGYIIISYIRNNSSLVLQCERLETLALSQCVATAQLLDRKLIPF